ncbi:MAG: hypothetical protein PHE68_02040 [Candidatus Peribacteraceae bacterium]|nr:hypothetical protein [Candidatus Peribacteraceae bacterium]MDD5074455.1 hypothetical protein [Candidatus Peribacteraceae bacterium]
MKRPVLLVSLALSFLVPALALATFARPSDVLFTLNSDGKPREFDSTFYMKVDDSSENMQIFGTDAPSDTIRIFGTVSGMAEGKSLKDAKLQMHADVTAAADEGKGSASVDLMVRGETAYVRIGDVSLKLADVAEADIKEWLATFNKEFKGKWFTIPLTTSELESLGGMSSSDLLNEFGADSGTFTQADVKELFARVLDAMFTIEGTRYKEGSAYLLTLKSHFLQEAVNTARSFLKEKDPSLLQDGTLDVDMQELEAIETQILKALTIRLKVDINNEGAFRFAKYFASVTVPEANVFFSMEGKMQHRPLPVYLDIPENAEKLEDHLMNLGLPSIGTPIDASPFDATPSWEPTFTQPSRTGGQSDPCLSQTPEGVFANRTGACPLVRESRRHLKERVLRDQNQ